MLGYGRFSVPGPGKWKMVMAHRFAWELAHGPTHTGLDVCHACDNPPCVRIDHLFVGTHKENMSDMAAKNRCGRNPHQRINEADVVRVLNKATEFPGMSQPQIAALLGISRGAVSHIENGTTWRRVHARERALALAAQGRGPGKDPTGA